MKKYLFGAIAIMMALSIVAFTKPSSGKTLLTTMYFVYSGTDLSNPEVIEAANWTITGSPSEFCGTTESFPCVVKVEDLTDLDVDFDIDADDFELYLQALENGSAGAAADYIDDPTNKVRTRVEP